MTTRFLTEILCDTRPLINPPGADAPQVEPDSTTSRGPRNLSEKRIKYLKQRRAKYSKKRKLKKKLMMWSQCSSSSVNVTLSTFSRETCNEYRNTLEEVIYKKIEVRRSGNSGGNERSTSAGTFNDEHLVENTVVTHKIKEEDVSKCFPNCEHLTTAVRGSDIEETTAGDKEGSQRFKREAEDTDTLFPPYTVKMEEHASNEELPELKNVPGEIFSPISDISFTRSDLLDVNSSPPHSPTPPTTSVNIKSPEQLESSVTARYNARRIFKLKRLRGKALQKHCAKTFLKNCNERIGASIDMHREALDIHRKMLGMEAKVLELMFKAI